MVEARSIYLVKGAFEQMHSKQGGCFYIKKGGTAEAQSLSSLMG